MVSNLIKTITKAFLVLVLLAAFAPMRSLAADPTDLGKITIEVSDQNGAAIGGDWYLYAGATSNTLVARNGTKGEVFNFPAGTYFLEVRNIKTHPFYKVFSANPQTLMIKGSIRFQVQYFVTEAQKARATSAPTPATPAVTPTPAPVIEIPAPVTVTPAPVVQKKAPIKLTIIRPAVEDPAIAYDGPGEVGYQLATTGPNGLLGALLAFSLIAGLWIVKRKNA